MESTNKQAEDNQGLENYSDFSVEEDVLETERLIAQLVELEPPNHNALIAIISNMALFIVCGALLIYVFEVPKNSPFLLFLILIVASLGAIHQYRVKTEQRISVLTELVLKLKAKQDVISNKS